jgi:hypothetical protein
VSRTQHKPSEYKEQCYTCKKEFSSYFHLMNHRKSEHPSNKICRFFLKEECFFESDMCWYRHFSKSSDILDNSRVVHVCNKCEETFTEKSELMKHLKQVHPTTVQKCRNYAEGNCNLSNDYCWFAHPENEDQDVILDKAQEDSVFHKVQEKTPPDQMNHLIEVITKLAMQVRNLEKMSQNVR